MEKGITLSEKHGLNPSITHCECCGKEIGIALFGKLKNDEEAPKDVCMGLCDRCSNVIEQDGIIIIEVKDGETGNDPYRTGRITGLSKEGKEKLLKIIPFLEDKKSNIAYMEESLFSKLFNQVTFKENDTTGSN